MSPAIVSPYISARYCLRGWLLELVFLGATAPLLANEIAEVMELARVEARQLGGGDA